MQKVGEWRITDWLVMGWSFLLVMIALLAIFPGLGVAWKWMSDHASEIASWVQAVGSIAAIAAGFGVARFQLQEQKREALEKIAQERLQKEIRDHLLLADKITMVVDFFSHLRRATAPNPFYFIERTNSLANLLIRIDQASIPSFTGQSIIHQSMVNLNGVMTILIGIQNSEPGYDLERLTKFLDKHSPRVKLGRNWLLKKARYLCTPEEWLAIGEDWKSASGKTWPGASVQPLDETEHHSDTIIPAAAAAASPPRAA